MCGISGIVDFAEAVESQRIHAMNAILRHRGPDDFGIWADRHVAFGFQRLAIVDVAHGRQPTGNEDDTIRVVFNGEIYNHRRLRRLLEDKGHRLRSGSDAEVIPHLYEEYGDRFVEHLDGDFAIAVWDNRNQRLILTRDRVGVKPLFYYHSGSRVVFASEIKGIMASGHYDIEIDRQGMADCLFYGHTIAPHTFWRDVRDLQPGTIATIDANGIRSRRYFTVFERPDPDKPLLKGRAAIEAFSERFTAAVAKRVPDEVRAGVALSGGLDSSAIAAVAAKRCASPLPTASLHLTGEIHDETDMSRLVAESLGVRNDEAEMTGARACELLPKSMWHFESPFWYGGVASPFLDLTRLARDQGLTVAMSGDGSDELLAGYDFYRLMKISSKLDALKLGALQPMLWQQATKWVGAPSGLDRHISCVATRFGEYTDRFGQVPPWIYLWSALDEAVRPAVTDQLPAPSPLAAPPRHTTLHRQMHFEFSTRLPHWVLPISDRLGMAHSVEVRVPFLDRDVIDICAEIDPGMLVHLGTEKYVLKRAVADVLPKQIVRRRKKPFMTPVGGWYLSGPGAELAGDHLSQDAVRRYGLFDPVATEKIWRTAVDGAGTWEGAAAEWAAMSVLCTHIVLDQFTPERVRAAATVEPHTVGAPA
ncbi:asparagine synthase (glutamine-hydrolyzing) [Nocardia huaxiensis]|uniref:asparagine synthase (glutamine-hydrolyzing) n=1 Tax=Nocardia huaxiensis TaxID=2755382 RepID=A0A7D6ZA31_9NOCA|nr:asparagine synthase (glutamine-hydrolyzing) [Nocardia huaxiensis]QLY28698.1 asparagine synthase (glutamine-hydrolyzing) [Nocardia huaxiensis]